MCVLGGSLPLPFLSQPQFCAAIFLSAFPSFVCRGERDNRQAGGGNWGQSDAVVVKARNRVVVEETERALADGCRKIMILYGGLHMQVRQSARRLCFCFTRTVLYFRALQYSRIAW